MDYATARPPAGPRRATVVRVARELEAWGWERGWRGRDPYDALNGSRAAVLGRTPLARRVVIQLARRSPIDLSGPLGVPRGENANTIAHVLGAYARMDPALGIDGSARASWAIDRLEALRAPGYDEPCWSYHFDVETRFFFYSADTPNAIATAFAAHSLLDAHERLGSARALKLATGAGEFFLSHIVKTPASEDGAGAYLGYFPGDATPIHNASMLGASVLARLAAITGRDDFAAPARDAVAYCLAHQREDGSWPYAEGDVGGWVDNFHTAYVLDALLRCAEALDDDAARAAWTRGMRYFRERLFDPDGAPRHTNESRYPIDGQSIAQSIETFAVGARIHPELLNDARLVLDFGVERMQRSDGAFAYQRHRRFVNRAPHVRWVEAPMLSALVRLDEAERSIGASR